MRKEERENDRVGGYVCMICERQRQREGQSWCVQAMLKEEREAQSERVCMYDM